MRYSPVLLRPGLLVLVVLLLVIVPAGASAEQAKNVILLIGDGYGVAQHTLARMALAGPDGRLPSDTIDTIGLVSTHSADYPVTDSAAAGTALASGSKTRNGMLGMAPDGSPLGTIMAAAQEAGLAAGLVSDTRLTHATPAAFLAAVEQRDLEAEIAEQLLAARPQVMLGGGWGQFLPREDGGWRKDGRDLLAEARKNGYRVVRSRAQLLSDDGASERLLGVFNDSHLDYCIDRGESRTQPTLAQMTGAALDRLGDHPRGFVLMVEGGRIDHALHIADTATMIRECRGFQEAVGAALEFASGREDTLVVITADHATGGLAISENLDIEVLLSQRHSAGVLARMIKNEEPGDAIHRLSQLTGIPADAFAPYRSMILQEYGSGYGAGHEIGYAISLIAGVACYPPSFQARHRTTHGHSGELVMVLAAGPGAERFGGFMDNTEIPRRIAGVLGLPFPAGERFPD